MLKNQLHFSAKVYYQKFPFSAILTQTLIALLIVAVIHDYYIAMIAIKYHQASHRHSEELDLNTTTAPKISKKSKKIETKSYDSRKVNWGTCLTTKSIKMKKFYAKTSDE